MFSVLVSFLTILTSLLASPNRHRAKNAKPRELRLKFTAQVGHAFIFRSLFNLNVSFRQSQPWEMPCRPSPNPPTVLLTTASSLVGSIQHSPIDYPFPSSRALRGALTGGDSGPTRPLLWRRRASAQHLAVSIGGRCFLFSFSEVYR